MCRYQIKTKAPWFLQKPDGAKTIRCYLPDALNKAVAGGLVRYATINDTFDLTKPAKPQIIPDADYVCVRECKCNAANCRFYEE